LLHVDDFREFDDLEEKGCDRICRLTALSDNGSDDSASSKGDSDSNKDTSDIGQGFRLPELVVRPSRSELGDAIADEVASRTLRSIVSTFGGPFAAVRDAVEDFQKKRFGSLAVTAGTSLIPERALGPLLRLPPVKKLASAISKAIGDLRKSNKIKVPSNQLPTPENGTKVFRVFGEKNNPLGESFTDVDPRTVENFRSEAGLPDVNTGRFVLEGQLIDNTGVTTRRALPLDGNPGGLSEIVIPDAEKKVLIERVSGANPEF
jgi:hypothetical protein